MIIPQALQILHKDIQIAKHVYKGIQSMEQHVKQSVEMEL